MQGRGAESPVFLFACQLESGVPLLSTTIRVMPFSSAFARFGQVLCSRTRLPRPAGRRPLVIGHAFCPYWIEAYARLFHPFKFFHIPRRFFTVCSAARSDRPVSRSTRRRAQSFPPASVGARQESFLIFLLFRPSRSDELDRSRANAARTVITSVEPQHREILQSRWLYAYMVEEAPPLPSSISRKRQRRQSVSGCLFRRRFLNRPRRKMSRLVEFFRQRRTSDSGELLARSSGQQLLFFSSVSLPWSTRRFDSLPVSVAQTFV